MLHEIVKHFLCYLEQHFQEKSALDGTVLESDLMRSIGIVPVGHRDTGTHCVISIPQKLTEELKVFSFFREASYPQKPIGFCIFFTAIERDTERKRFFFIADYFVLIEAFGKKIRFPDFIPNRIIFQAEGVFEMITQSGAAVIIFRSFEE